MDTLKPKFIEPKQPDVLPILRLHRSNDGFVTFHRKPTPHEDDFENLFAVPASQLEEYFPQFISELERDSYYSVNAYWRGGRSRSRYHPKLTTPLRRKFNLQWLTACFVDLDIYKSDLSIGNVIGAIIDYQDDGTIPPASMLVRSGRGVWAFWILQNDDPKQPLGGPIRAWPEALDAYCKIQRELGERLAHLESDAQARDPVRVSRVPGSLHTRVGQRVSYWFQASPDGRGFTYTLRDLCKVLDVQTRKYHPRVKRACDPKLTERGHRGYRGRWFVALREFETLRAVRIGFREGHRNKAAWLYASLLATAKPEMPAREIREEVYKLGRECRDATGRHPSPLSHKECRDAYETKVKLSKLSNQYIADALEITPEEASLLESWPVASKHRRDLVLIELKPLTRAEKKERRRAAIKKYVQQLGGVPTLEEMRSVLESSQFEAPSVPTIKADYAALGITNPRRHGRKREISERELKLLPE